MLDEAVMDRTYYMGLQSARPEDDPLHLAGLADNLEGVTDGRDAVNAAAAAANFNINPAPVAAFHPQMNALPAAPPAMAVHVSYRTADRSRKQKVLSARQKDLLHDEWRAEKDRLQQLEEQEKKRQKRQQALVAARAAAKVTAEARKLKAQALQQKAAATRKQRAAAAAAAAARNAEAAVSGAAAGGVSAAASSAAAGAEAAGVSGLGVGAVGASARDNGGAAPPLTQSIGRASTRMRVPSRKFLDEVPAAEGLAHNSPVKAIKGRASTTSPTKTASRLEPQPPARLSTRATPRSPAKGPHTPALHEAATIFSRAAAHSPGVRTSSPTAPFKGMDEVQDGRVCEPRRCSCCWAFTKASGAGAPTWRKGSIAPFVGMMLCNACGIFEARHGKSLLECTEPVRVNRCKAEYNALYGGQAGGGGGSGGGNHKGNGGGHASGGGTVSSRDIGADSDTSGGSSGAGLENGGSGGDSRPDDGADEMTASQVLAELKYAEAQGPSLQHSSSQVGTNLVGDWGSPGQGSSTDFYLPSPNLNRGDAGQSCSPSVQSSLPQGMPFGGTLEGSTEGLGKAASLPFSPAAALQLTHQHAQAALGTAAQRDRNASFGESSTAVGQQHPYPARQYDNEPLTNDKPLTDEPLTNDDEPLTNDCARPLSDKSLKNSRGSASAAVTQVSKKRAAEVSCAEPDAKRGSSGGQGSTAAGGAVEQMGEATTDVDSDGDCAMADGDSNGKGRRRLLRLRKKGITTAVGNQGNHGGEDIEAVARYQVQTQSAKSC